MEVLIMLIARYYDDLIEKKAQQMKYNKS